MSKAAATTLADHVASSGLSAEAVVLAALDQFKETLKREGRLDPGFEWAS